MNAWILTQIFVNLILFSGVLALWVRLSRPAKDDPRMSRGLQLLQSKIAVLEDLSDRTEIQVQQLTLLLEKKCKEIQQKIEAADQQLSLIDKSMKKNLEMTDIFQNQIPHQEIVERQNSMKYIKAAKMAHEGKTVAEISRAVDLSISEIELIAKVNKDQLMFAEDSLPGWAMPRDIQMNVENVFEVPQSDQEALRKLGEQFKKAQVVAQATKPEQTTTQTMVQNGRTIEVKPFEFKKIDFNGNLS